MKFEDQSISFEIAIELRKLGYKRDCQYAWRDYIRKGKEKREVVPFYLFEEDFANKKYRAYTIAEMVEEFKVVGDHVYGFSWFQNKWCFYSTDHDFSRECDKLVDCVGWLLVYMVKEGLIKKRISS